MPDRNFSILCPVLWLPLNDVCDTIIIPRLLYYLLFWFLTISYHYLFLLYKLFWFSIFDNHNENLFFCHFASWFHHFDSSVIFTIISYFKFSRHIFIYHLIISVLFEWILYIILIWFLHFVHTVSLVVVLIPCLCAFIWISLIFCISNHFTFQFWCFRQILFFTLWRYFSFHFLHCLHFLSSSFLELHFRLLLERNCSSKYFISQWSFILLATSENNLFFIFIYWNISHAISFLCSSSLIKSHSYIFFTVFSYEVSFKIFFSNSFNLSRKNSPWTMLGFRKRQHYMFSTCFLSRFTSKCFQSVAENIIPIDIRKWSKRSIPSWDLLWTTTKSSRNNWSIRATLSAPKQLNGRSFVSSTTT